MKIHNTSVKGESQPKGCKPWTIKKINNWYFQNGWPIGCNYIPHNAVNQLEMWQADTFSPEIIDKELSWAASLGFNSIRVFLHHLLWEHEKDNFLDRVDTFLSIASKHGIKTMLVLFDGVWDPFPKYGKQPEPRSLVHNSGWVQSPGYEILNDDKLCDDLYYYVHAVVTHFKNDKRVLVWDLFNEPDNLNGGSYKDNNSEAKPALSLSLLKKCVGWIRNINPCQPITMAPWQCGWGDITKLSELDNYMFANSDIISFHCYEKRNNMEKHILDLLRYKRPMLCTEYMARPLQSTFKKILPLLKKYNIGAYNWGFVAGKSQTNIAWDSWQKTYLTAPDLWFHDVLRVDGQPYCKKEIAYLIKFNKKHAC